LLDLRRRRLPPSRSTLISFASSSLSSGIDYILEIRKYF
jgi:hypothetical protein